MNQSLKEQAFTLRLQGRSYNEIRKILNIPWKGTLSYWFHDLVLTPAAKRRLAKHIERAQEQGLLEFNRKRSAAILAENKKGYASGEAQIGTLTKRELFLVGVALYWGEGTKRINGSNPMVALANSDHYLVKLYMRFLRECLVIPEERIRAGIHIHPNLDREKTLRFWARITKLPIERFYVVDQISSASKQKRPKYTLPYGTVSIRVHSRLWAHRMLGCLAGLRSNTSM